MASSAIKTPAFQAKAGNIQNEDGSSIYSNGDWSLKNSTAVASVTITDAGNVGVGVTPSAWSNQFKAIQIGSRSALYQDSSAATAVGNNIYNDGTNRYLTTGAATVALQDSGAHIWYGAASGTAGNAITFTERMRIDASGEVTIGTAGADNTTHWALGRLVVYRKTSGTGNYVSQVHSDVGGTNVIRWRVEADGDTISATGSYTSDERAKKNLEPIQYGLSEILKLQPKAFNWWYEEDAEVKSFCVSTAQEVQSIMPEMVRDDGLDGPNGEQMKAVYEKELLPVLVKAIQELSAKNEALEARLAALEAK